MLSNHIGHAIFNFLNIPINVDLVINDFKFCSLNKKIKLADLKNPFSKSELEEIY